LTIAVIINSITFFISSLRSFTLIPYPIHTSLYPRTAATTFTRSSQVFINLIVKIIIDTITDLFRWSKWTDVLIDLSVTVVVTVIADLLLGELGLGTADQTATDQITELLAHRLTGAQPDDAALTKAKHIVGHTITVIIDAIAEFRDRLRRCRAADQITAQTITDPNTILRTSSYPCRTGFSPPLNVIL